MNRHHATSCTTDSEPATPMSLYRRSPLKRVRRLAIGVLALVAFSALVVACSDDDTESLSPPAAYTKYFVEKALDRLETEG